MAGASALPPGKHKIAYDFVPDDAAPGAGGTSRLRVNGKQVGEAHVPKTMPYMYSADEGVDVGTDNETEVTDDYAEGDNVFTGRILGVTVTAK